MNSIIIQTTAVILTSFMVTRFAIPELSKLSKRIGLTDKPNKRKVHTNAIPLIGGICIVLGTGFSALSSEAIQNFMLTYPIPMLSALAIFAIGVWDDKSDLPARLRLIIQLSAAIAVSYSEIRISSLHGIFGIGELPLIAQHVLTVVVITGTSNAFNLIDGIDGLAGRLALINTTILSVVFGFMGDHGAMLFLLSLAAGLVPFLQANNHPARIFMGDGGSMFFGFITGVTGILFIESNSAINWLNNETAVLLISTLLALPVADALRVFLVRYTSGQSIFNADKTHIHHLILDLGLNHNATANTIMFVELVLVAFGLVLINFFPITGVLIAVFSSFLFFSKLLKINTQLINWEKRIRSIERNQD